MISKAIKEDFIKRAQRRIDTKVQMLGSERQDTIAFTVGQLEELESTIFDTLFSNPLDAFKHVPMRAAIDPAITTYTYRMVEKLGEAKIMSDKSQDRPLVDATMTATSRNVVSFGAAYDYEVNDAAASQILDFDFVQMKARACAEAVARAHNEFALSGGAGVEGGDDLGITGFYNDANVASATLTDAAWGTVTPADAYASVNDIIELVITQSNAAHAATDVLLPTFCYNLLSRTLHTTASDLTVLESLKRNNPGVTFHHAPSLNDFVAATQHRVVAYDKRADVVEYVHSVMYDEAAPDKSGFHYKVQGRGKAAGTVVRYPLACAYGTVTEA